MFYIPSVYSRWYAWTIWYHKNLFYEVEMPHCEYFHSNKTWVGSTYGWVKYRQMNLENSESGKMYQLIIVFG